MADNLAAATPISTGSGTRQSESSRRTPSHTPGQQKRHNNRGKKSQLHVTGMPHVDGAVSDSYAAPQSSPKPRNGTPRHNATANAQKAYNNQQSTRRQHRPLNANGASSPETPAKEQAYAGPTFQASPAPSSLPVPKFFSRSVPNASGMGPLQERMVREEASDKDSSPEPDNVAVEGLGRKAQQSPLDVFFKADRAEREKRRAVGRLVSPQATSATVSQSSIPNQANSVSSRQMFMQELDGHEDSDETDEPHDSPFGNRFNSVRNNASTGPANASREQNERDAYTQSLKQMLFSGAKTAAVQTPLSPGVEHSMHRTGNNESLQIPPPPPPPPQPQPPFNHPQSPGHHLATPNQQAQHAFLYGNRNLSPLFQASRGESESQSTRPQFGYASHGPAAQDMATNGAYYASPPYESRVVFPPPAEVAGQRRSPQPQGSGGGARDIGAMENDLRRMLKLNAVT